MATLKTVAQKLIKNEDGAALVEYGMLVALIAAICVVAIKSIGQKVSTGFSNVDKNLP